jgi:hypothetical protein
LSIISAAQWKPTNVRSKLYSTDTIHFQSESTLKGWELLSLCCGSFLPSNEFYNVMKLMFDTMCANFPSSPVASPTAVKSRNYHGMENNPNIFISRVANYCNQIMRKLKSKGYERMHPPSEKEIADTKVESYENTKLDFLHRDIFQKTKLTQ